MQNIIDSKVEGFEIGHLHKSELIPAQLTYNNPKGQTIMQRDYTHPTIGLLKFEHATVIENPYENMDLTAVQNGLCRLVHKAKRVALGEGYADICDQVAIRLFGSTEGVDVRQYKEGKFGFDILLIAKDREGILLYPYD